MGWTTAAIIGTAVVSGIASSNAASAQKSAAASASGVSKAQYEQTREDLAPWRQIGGQAINELGALYGFPREVGPGSAAGQTIDQDGNPLASPEYGFPDVNDQARFGIPALPGEQATPVNALARQGRYGDTEIAHLTTDEAVVPESVAAALPGGRNALLRAYRERGLDPGRYIVGGADDSINPATGVREFPEPGGAGTGPGDGGYGGGGGYGGDSGGDPDRSFGSGDAGKYGFDIARQGPGSQDVEGRAGGGDGNFLYRSGGGGGGGGGNAPAPAAPGPYDYLPDDFYSQANAIRRFYDSPDYLINFDEGAKALERSAAARGGLFSGNTATGLVRYGQDYGNRLYSQYANRLASFAGFGQTAATNTGQFGAYASEQQGNALLYGGNAAAQGWEGMANAINAGVGNALYYDYLKAA